MRVGSQRAQQSVSNSQVPPLHLTQPIVRCLVDALILCVELLAPQVAVAAGVAMVAKKADHDGVIVKLSVGEARG